MKKITLLVSDKEREKFISELRRAGVLHVRHVTEPAHHEINFIEDKLAIIEKALDALDPHVKVLKEEPHAELPERDIIELTETVQDIYKEKKELQSRNEDLKAKLFWFTEWGMIEPGDIELLRSKNIYPRLYRVPLNECRKIKSDSRLRILGKSGGNALVLAVFFSPDETLPFEEETPPKESPEALAKSVEENRSRIAEIDELLGKEARYIKDILECRKKLERENEFQKVKFGMHQENTFAYLQGFCPDKNTAKITALAKRYGTGYLVEDPSPSDEVPTLITNPAWIRIIEPVLTFMNTVPGYEEYDVSFCFLAFLSLFFAMLIGDAGYGSVFIAMTYFARRKFKKAPPEPFFLMYLMSAGTVLWGAVTGTWFGSSAIGKLPFLHSMVVPRLDSFKEGNEPFIIFLCFIIGAVHLTIAHLLRLARKSNSIQLLSEAGWIMIVWGMFFAAGKFVLSKTFPVYGFWLLGAGSALALFFSNPQNGILKGALTTIAELPLRIISAFSDVVSYLRLFAVGYAGVVVSASFNDMALGAGANGPAAAFLAAFALFFGHALNIVLGLMAVIVHGIRLNMLEFSGHLGMQWSGRKYEPFTER